MTTYRCAVDGLMPSGVCEYYRGDSRTCGAPDPDHCSDALYEDRPSPRPDDEGPSAGLDQGLAGKWRAPR